MNIPMPSLPVPALPALSMGSLWPIVVLVLLGAALGTRRGWVRELGGLVLTLLLWTIVGFLGLPLVESANRIWLIVRFVWAGGFDLPDPVPLLNTLRATPAVNLFEPQLFLGVVFFVGVALANLAANQLGPRATTATDAFLGALVGALTGYLVAHIGLGFVGAGVEIPAGLGRLTIVLAIVAVITMIGIAVIATMRYSHRDREADSVEGAF